MLCVMQEIAPFLRVLGCYPMDLDAGDFQETAAEERQLSSNGASGPAGNAVADDSLLFSAAGPQRRAPAQVGCPPESCCDHAYPYIHMRCIKHACPPLFTSKNLINIGISEARATPAPDLKPSVV